MEKKLDRYYDYIAENLCSKTEVEDGYKIILPFSSIYSYDSILPMSLYGRGKILDQFINYIIRNYGAREEDYNPIWQRYRRLVNDNLIKK